MQTSNMRDQLTDLIVQKLNESKEHLKKQFFFEHPIKVARHFVLDNLLPTEMAERIYNHFPKQNQMHLLNSYGELKLKCSHIKHTTELLQDLHFAIQNPRVVSVVEDITEIKNQIPDTSRLAGGVSRLLKGYYINPHLDNSHDSDKKFYRTVNVLYYVSPNWKEENGGNYELWDKVIENRIIVPSFFNRLVVMETNRMSWHSVNPVLCDASRCCVFNYFFSEQSPEGEDYFHGSSFSFFNPLFRPRPEQKIRRAISRMRERLLGRTL
jgi:Rps23 Pro-64 3,4-dihydroxylase Tpa1-like proline 4-hydroxylase